MGIWRLCPSTKRKACGFPADAGYFFRGLRFDFAWPLKYLARPPGTQKRSPCAVSRPQISSRFNLVTHPISVRTVGLGHCPVRDSPQCYFICPCANIAFTLALLGISIMEV